MPSPPAPTPILVYEHLCATAQGSPTSADAHLLEQGRAMRDAMLADLAALPGLAPHCAVSNDAPGPPLPSGVTPLPLPVGTPPAEWLAAQAQVGHRIWAVAPETEGILLALARAVPASHWLGCSAAAIALATSKRATTQHLALHGVPVPTDTAHLARRWIVKPDDGAGGGDTQVHDQQHAALADAARRPTPAVVEPWVDGAALSLSLVCRPDQPPRLLSVNRQHVEVDAQGTLHWHGVTPAAWPLDDTPRAAALQALAARIAQAIPGLAGYVGVDFVWHPHLGPVVIEINPRLTSAYVGLSAALGFNVAALLCPMPGT